MTPTPLMASGMAPTTILLLLGRRSNRCLRRCAQSANIACEAGTERHAGPQSAVAGITTPGRGSCRAPNRYSVTVAGLGV